MRLKETYFMLIAALVSSGCAVGHTSGTKKAVAVDPAISRLEEAAAAIHKDLQQLLASQTSEKSHASSGYPMPQSGPLAQEISFRWSGPVGPAVKALAQQCGLTFVEIGRPPAEPPLVNVNVFERPVIEILEGIGGQVGSSVELKVMSGFHEIQLIYGGGR